MKEIIPLKKDIVFKTLIGKITNVDLEHEYKVKDEILEGNVLLSGTYKMTEASVIEEDFFYKIPFKVALSKNIDKDSISIEIDDFKYECNKDIMSVSIDLELSCNEIIENKSEDDKLIEEYFNNEEEIKENKEEEIETTINEEHKDIDIEQNINNIKDNIINNENKYYTYKVYIVRQNDNVESICSKYNVTLNDLKEYNDLSNINIGDKIIIPQINE